MPYILDAVRASATVGENCEALRGVFGLYLESNAHSHELVLYEAGNPSFDSDRLSRAFPAIQG
jgi:hypothetical protein